MSHGNMYFSMHTFSACLKIITVGLFLFLPVFFPSKPIIDYKGER